MRVVAAGLLALLATFPNPSADGDERSATASVPVVRAWMADWYIDSRLQRLGFVCKDANRDEFPYSFKFRLSHKAISALTTILREHDFFALPRERNDPPPAARPHEWVYYGLSIEWRGRKHTIARRLYSYAVAEPPPKGGKYGFTGTKIAGYDGFTLEIMDILKREVTRVRRKNGIPYERCLYMDNFGFGSRRIEMWAHRAE